MYIPNLNLIECTVSKLELFEEFCSIGHNVKELFFLLLTSVKKKKKTKNLSFTKKN